MELTLNPIMFKENSLSEIGQTINTLFSFATINKDNTVDRLHEWVKCRDFLGDVLFSNKYKVPFNIYHFQADRVKRGENLEFVVKFPTDKIKENFISNYEKIIHPIEVHNGLELTSVKWFMNLKENTALITADKWWTSAIPLISLYTFLIKVCCYTYTDPTKWMTDITAGVEKGYIGTTERVKRLETLLANLKFVFSEFPNLSGWKEEANLDKYTIHNSSGFFTLFMNGLESENMYTKKFAELMK